MDKVWHFPQNIWKTCLVWWFLPTSLWCLKFDWSFPHPSMNLKHVCWLLYISRMLRNFFFLIMEALFFFLMYLWSEGTQLMLHILLQFAWWPMNLTEAYNWAPNDHVRSVYPHKLKSFHLMPHVWMIEPFDACFMTFCFLVDLHFETWAFNLSLRSLDGQW